MKTAATDSDTDRHRIIRVAASDRLANFASSAELLNQPCSRVGSDLGPWLAADHVSHMSRVDSGFATEGNPVIWNGRSLLIAQIGAPIAICDESVSIVGLTPAASSLLERLGIDGSEIPFLLPEKLRHSLTNAATGEAIAWRPENRSTTGCLGCTKYRLGSTHWVVLMQEVSEKQAELSRRLHQQRLDTNGKLVASVAHDLRTCVASILYNADFLSGAVDDLPLDEIAETSQEIHTASKRLDKIVSRLLDFARLGPPVVEKVCLHDVLKRVKALVGPLCRERGHALSSNIREEASWVSGNPFTIDQILVAVLNNAFDAGEDSLTVSVESELAANSAPRGSDDPARTSVRIVVRDDGPGVADADRESIFQPFFTTRPQHTGIGLTTAREAARELGGDVVLEQSKKGAQFAIVLPAALSRVNEHT